MKIRKGRLRGGRGENAEFAVKDLYFWAAYYNCLTLHQCRTLTPVIYSPNALGVDACRRSQILWIRTLERITKVGNIIMANNIMKFN